MPAHPAQEPPSGAGWIREIKHDGFRIMARRDGTRVRLYTRNGYNFADRFPQIVEAISDLLAESCFLDGEAIVVDERGLSVFNLLRYRCYDHAVVLCAFDPIELTAMTCVPSRLSSGRIDLETFFVRCGAQTPALRWSITGATPQSSTSISANSAVRALSRSASAPRTDPAAQIIDSRSRTRWRQR